MEKVVKITLDTNVVIQGIDGEKALFVDCLKKLAEEGKIDIALTTRAVADKDRDKDEARKAKHLKEFEQYPWIPTVGRFGFSRYDYDVYG